jgi:hypothetical protein
MKCGRGYIVKTRTAPRRSLANAPILAMFGSGSASTRIPSWFPRGEWTVRTTMRRYTRLSNGFSRKMESHAVATALNYFAYNFIKIHLTLRTSPAMAAGITDRPRGVEDLMAFWEAYEQQGGGKERRRKGV